MPNSKPGEEEQIKNPRREGNIDEIGAAGREEDTPDVDEDDEEFQDDEESEEDEDVDEEAAE